MSCAWTDAAPREAELIASTAANWRARLADPVADVALVYWGEEPPFDLQVLARILEEGVLRGGKDRMGWRWVRLEADALLPPAALSVLAQDVSRHAPPETIRQIAERSAPTALVGPAAMWFATSAAARGLRVAIHWEDAASREHLADDVVPSPSIIEVSGRWTTCAGGFAVADLGLLMLSELVGSGVALQVMDALCMDRLREPGSRQRTAAAGVLGALVPKLAEAIALMEANVEEPLQTD